MFGLSVASSGTVFGWSDLAIALLAPIVAGIVVFVLQRSFAARDRRLLIFRTLMARRREPLARDYIDALNQIEVEFYKFSDVRQAHQELMDFFGDRNHWDRLVELENRSTLSEEDKKRYQSFFDNHRSKLESLVVRLLEVIGIRLRYRFEQLDLLKGGYAPTAYGEIENDQVSIRRLFAQIGRGERALPVMTYAPQPLSKTERSE